MLKEIIIGISIVAATQQVHAHEGHDEPKVMPAPKGGITRANEKYFFEYVYKSGGGTVYLYTLDAKPAPVAGITANAVFEIPRQKKPVDAVVTPDGNSWKISAELPKAHRLTLKFSIKAKEHDDKFTFVVEPK